MSQSPEATGPLTPHSISQELGPDNVLVVTLDVKAEKVNALSRALMTEFGALIEALETRTDVTGVVLRSGKADTFIAGADIRDFGLIRSQLEGETLSRGGQALLDRLAALPMPVVAAINGACLGGGLEVALACRYRVATDDARTVLGVPEVMLGLIPGAGGTQRLPRVVGLAAALDLILTGRSLKPRRALKMGLVDEVVAPAALLQAAREAAVALADGSLRPRRRGISLTERLLRPIIFKKAQASVVEKGGAHYPAPLRAIEAVRVGTAGSLAEGLKVEAHEFGTLAVSDVSRALVSVFFATQEIKKDAGYPEGTEPSDVKKLAVLGAGLMGAGIAGTSADAGARVRLRDTAEEALGRALRHTRELLEERKKRGSLTRLDVEKKMDLVSVTRDYTGFRRAELVIEAVFEDIVLKRKVVAEIEAVTPDTCVLASNTSSLPITEIAKESKRPSRIVGMHFFSPVHKMPLLEVIVTEQTDAWATATAVTFGRRLGKHVIVVRDGPGFYTTRALAPYLNEAARLLEECVAVESIDKAMTDFGFPVGPVTLMDEVGIDVGAKVAHVLHAAFGERMAPPAAMARVVEDGRLGRKSKRGFYLYQDGKKKGVDTSVYALLGTAQPRRDVDAQVIQERLVFAFLNEAVLCLQDGILRTPRDGDVGAIFGLGFPPFLGGPFRYLDHLGARFAAEVLERLAAQHGPRFQPADLLVSMARDGRSFHQ